MTPNSRRGPVVIGLMAGVAAGKSTVAGMFAAAGLQVLDADAVARQVTEDPAVLARIEARFGPQVRNPAGGLDRATVADLVFRDPEARRDLEAITHPQIRAELLRQLETAKNAGRSVLLDVPLLLEGGLIEHCDTNVFIQTEDATRQARARGRGWDDAELARREASQAPLAAKRAAAQHVIHNDGDLADTEAQVQALLTELREAHA